MDILYYRKEYNTQMNQWQKFHIIDELEDHGCTVRIINPILYENLDKANEELVNYIKKNRIDLFITPYNENVLYINTLNEIKKLGIPTVLICFDNLVIPYEHKYIARYFDLVWLTSRETEYLFKRWGAKTIFLPYAANPKLCNPHFQSNSNDVVFIGTPYGSRVNVLNDFIENNIPLSIHSNFNSNTINEKKIIDNLLFHFINMVGFKEGRKILVGAIKKKILKNVKLKSSCNTKFYNSVQVQDMKSIYCNHSLSLSITSAKSTGVLKKPVNIINLRSFEIPMCGGLQICEYLEELSNYFKEDKEIIFYRSKEDMIDKCNFYLNEKQESLVKKMKLASRLRAENDHTWYSRFKKVFEELGIKNLI